MDGVIWFCPFQSWPGVGLCQNQPNKHLHCCQMWTISQFPVPRVNTTRGKTIGKLILNIFKVKIPVYGFYIRVCKLFQIWTIMNLLFFVIKSFRKCLLLEIENNQNLNLSERGQQQMSSLLLCNWNYNSKFLCCWASCDINLLCSIEPDI